MIDVHYWPTPNGKKLTVQLEECGAEYNVVYCSIGTGEQFSDSDWASGQPDAGEPAWAVMQPDGKWDDLADDSSGGLYYRLWFVCELRMAAKQRIVA